MRKHGRRDANHQEIRQELEQLGATVQDLADVGGGCPDLLVGWRRVNFLFEVKSPKATLNENEDEWFKRWRGLAHVISNAQHAIRIMEHYT